MIICSMAHVALLYRISSYIPLAGFLTQSVLIDAFKHPQMVVFSHSGKQLKTTLNKTNKTHLKQKQTLSRWLFHSPSGNINIDIWLWGYESKNWCPSSHRNSCLMDVHSDKDGDTRFWLVPYHVKRLARFHWFYQTCSIPTPPYNQQQQVQSPFFEPQYCNQSCTSGFTSWCNQLFSAMNYS